MKDPGRTRGEGTDTVRALRAPDPDRERVDQTVVTGAASLRTVGEPVPAPGGLTSARLPACPPPGRALVSPAQRPPIDPPDAPLPGGGTGGASFSRMFPASATLARIANQIRSLR